MVRTNALIVLVGLLASSQASADSWRLAMPLGRDERELAAEEPALRRAAGLRLRARQPDRAAALVAARGVSGESDPATRVILVDVLARAALPEAVPLLVDLLGDAEREVFLAALRALVAIGDRRATDALAERFAHGDDDPELAALLARAGPQLRRRALESVQRIGSPLAARVLGASRESAAAPALISLLGHPDAGSRGAAAEALGELGDAAAVPALVAALDDRDVGVARAALEAVRRLGDVEVGRRLMTGDDAQLGVPAAERYAVALELARTAPRRLDEIGAEFTWLAGALARRECIEPLAVGVLSAPALRRDALSHLSRCTTDSSFEVLWGEAQARRDSESERALAFRIARGGAPARALPAVHAFLAQASSPRRATWLRAIAGDPLVVDPIVGALRAADPSERAAAWASWVWLDHGRADTHAIEALRRERDRGVARVALAALATREIALAGRDWRALGNRFGDVAAYWLLGGIVADAQPELVDETLRTGLASSAEGIRANAAIAIGMRRAPRLLPALYPLLDDPDPAVRLAAARALGAFGAGRANPSRLRAAARSEPDARVHDALVAAADASDGGARVDAFVRGSGIVEVEVAVAGDVSPTSIVARLVLGDGRHLELMPSVDDVVAWPDILLVGADARLIAAP